MYLNKLTVTELFLWNYETSHFEEKKTKNHERIIYANSQKAITYYKGKYLTYFA